ncbi:MAG TPA: deoxyribose-phosphate aldolase [Bacteroidales bacterium]|jgi:deoxyribose-phosphate aldolase|nr:deoxyribose-phosphate aldolase [Bacteroidales bacterium]HOL97349.1 deoxyribose-phosphate aldolase [Bacteroidales bacterium]HOM36080.1 deoxyribose-phosphate aldolase [Bacteroidales bacterium]HPD22915.1 deoxyribose-phosphate aldolase [Bacteroidales bacterium]HRS98583.1 deoxyribose-phosphate aldolase [Bacteroidales bacterium]
MKEIVNYPDFSKMPEIIESLKNQVSEFKTVEELKKIFNCIDLTSLNTNDTTQKISQMVEKVNQFNSNFPHFNNVAAICVYPSFVSLVRENLKDNKVSLAAVGANFPSSQTFLSVKIAECELIKEKGADEIDIVLSVGKFFDKEFDKVAAEINIIKKTIGEVHLKVILETGDLITLENIYLASIISMESGADFIKTSTGKTSVSATPEAVYSMCLAIKEHFNKTSKKIGIKPSGGIVTSEDAILYYLIVKNVLGEEWLNNKLFRLGASRLANNILTDVAKLSGDNKIINYF